MENHTVLTFTPVDHPDARVQRLGFDPAGPNVEQCWGPVIGPSATLWTERVPATVTHEELARSPHRLQRLPQWTRQVHERPLDAHVRQVALLEDTAPKVAAMTARLDRLQGSRSIQAAAPIVSTRAVER